MAIEERGRTYRVLYNNGGTVTTAQEVYIAAGSGVTFTPIRSGARVTVGVAVSAWSVTATKVAGYTALITDDLIPVDVTGGGFTIALPAAATATKPIRICRIDASGNTLTIDPDAAETIMGAATATLAANTTYALYPVGTDWRIV